MTHIEKTALIHHDSSAVWTLLTNRANAPHIVPNLIRVWDIAPSAAGLGQTWKFEFKILGITIQGTAKMIAFEPGRSYQFQTSNSIESRWTYTAAPEGPHARVTVAVDYTLPDTLWAKLKDKVALSRIHNAQIEEILINLEAKLGT
jgi:hypothetical protein